MTTGLCRYDNRVVSLRQPGCVASRETQTNQAEPKSQPKSQQIKTFIKNITLPSSPNLGRRPVAPPPAATGTTAAPAKKPPAAVASNDLQRSPKVRSGSGRWSHPPATGSSEQTLLPSGGQPRSRDGERSVTKAAKVTNAGERVGGGGKGEEQDHCRYNL